MSLFKRVFVTLKRNYGKTFVLFILFFLIGSLMAGSVSIQQAVQQTTRNLYRRLPVLATIEFDWDGFMRYHDIDPRNPTMDELINLPSAPRLTMEMVQEISDLPYVADTEHTLNTIFPEIQRARPHDMSMQWMWFPSDDFNVKGVNRSDFSDLELGLLDLVYGRTFTEEEIETADMQVPALISIDLASENQLSIGSTFTLVQTIYQHHIDMSNGYVWTPNTVAEVVYQQIREVEVVGIFDLGRELEGGGANSIRMEWDLMNQIYVPFGVVYSVGEFIRESLGNDLVADEANGEYLFLVQSPLYLTRFRERANDILPDFWYLIDFSDTFQAIAAPMENFLWMADQIFWASLGASLLILGLLVLLFLNDRKAEIGIYCALGDGKHKIVVQILMETLVIACVSLSLSLFTGHLLAQNLTESLIHDEVAFQQQQISREQAGRGMSGTAVTDVLSWFSPPEMTVEEMVESFQVTLDGESVRLFIGAGLATVLLATALPTLYLVRLSPKKILL